MWYIPIHIIERLTTCVMSRRTYMSVPQGRTIILFQHYFPSLGDGKYNLRIIIAAYNTRSETFIVSNGWPVNTKQTPPKPPATKPFAGLVSAIATCLTVNNLLLLTCANQILRKRRTIAKTSCTGIGKMRKYGMRKVKCGMKSAECTRGMMCRMRNAEIL